jgi:hypothetical protein
MISSPPLDKRIKAFVELGKIMGRAAVSLTSGDSKLQEEYPVFYDSLQSAGIYNPWFTSSNIAFALNSWKAVLTEESLISWVKQYNLGGTFIDSKRIAVIMAGNIPVVGFHDFLCTLMAGHCFTGKLSSDDKILLPAIADVLCQIEPAFIRLIQFTENTIHDFDAIIATGSNNTARYFEYYFEKYPHIIRKNRNGVAVLTSNESNEALERLGADICTYFGLGCRNVSKVFIPEGYDPKRLFTSINPYVKTLNDHYKYMNNHSYYRSVYLLNSTPHLDNDVFIIAESSLYTSPISVLYYEFYNNIVTLREKLSDDDMLIQCIANDAFTNNKTVKLGETQSPGLADYADGIDTMQFLLDL